MENKSLKILILLFFSPVILFYFAVFSLVSKNVKFVSSHSFIDVFDTNLFFSVIVSLLATILSIFIGAGLSYLIYNHKVFSSKIFRFVVFTPHLAFAYLIYLFFSPSGLLFRLIYPFFEDTILVNESFGIGILIHYILKEVPFTCLFLMGTHNIKESKLILISKDLGASKIETFFKVYLPLKKDTLIVLFILIFSYTLSSYEAPYILGHHSRKFISVEAIENFNSIDQFANIKAELQSLIILFVNCFFATLLFVKEKKR